MRLDTIGTTLGIIGAVFVALGEPLAANMVWVISNPMLIVHNLREKQYAQGRMFVVFFGIATIGTVNLLMQ